MVEVVAFHLRVVEGRGEEGGAPASCASSPRPSARELRRCTPANLQTSPSTVVMKVYWPSCRHCTGREHQRDRGSLQEVDAGFGRDQPSASSTTMDSLLAAEEATETGLQGQSTRNIPIPQKLATRITKYSILSRVFRSVDIRIASSHHLDSVQKQTRASLLIGKFTAAPSTSIALVTLFKDIPAVQYSRVVNPCEQGSSV